MKDSGKRNRKGRGLRPAASVCAILAVLISGPEPLILYKAVQLLLLTPAFVLIWHRGKGHSQEGAAGAAGEGDEYTYADNRHKDLHLAKLIQQSLLSQPLRTEGITIEGRYIPSHPLGGDMYAWYQLEEHRYGIMIMDVMGSGVAASLVCMSIRSLLEGIIRKCVDPEIVMMELNAHMYKLFRKTNSPLPFYFTALYAVIDTRSHTLEYINAGHTSGFLVHGETGMTELGSTSVPIGMMNSPILKKRLSATPVQAVWSSIRTALSRFPVRPFRLGRSRSRLR
ncbi:PP2C family protein-serine/threonine phosphatase [Paenibacillus hexagrammi]|uniref:Serine/threonine-protein phosphatase n=1 Tax=Paenibacillus hexagrammi TaxID=2908839 RepID=A0ABY3SHM3_9BACL|nr:PP2C family protein-serine/threonine phosphatase [Paenibacillus sp. YPD9-1]UJF32880.1 serine/threonine-protein phosphatase [Paenibacillus sp. YPD9-1]